MVEKKRQKKIKKSSPKHGNYFAETCESNSVEQRSRPASEGRGHTSKASWDCEFRGSSREERGKEDRLVPGQGYTMRDGSSGRGRVPSWDRERESIFFFKSLHIVPLLHVMLLFLYRPVITDRQRGSVPPALP